jgi:hypothetical protein
VRIASLLAVIVVALALPAPAALQPEVVDWSKKKSTYFTSHALPQGTEVRIRVEKFGNGTLNLVQWYGGKGKNRQYEVLKSWDSGRLRNGQVLRHVLSRPMAVGVRVLKKKDARSPSGLRAGFGHHEMRFGDRWRLDVKVVDPVF